MNDQACPKCHGAVAPGAKFCTRCGQPVTGDPRCPACGTPNKAGAWYCVGCGNPLAGPKGAAELGGGANSGGYGLSSLEAPLTQKIDERLKNIENRLRERQNRLGGDVAMPDGQTEAGSETGTDPQRNALGQAPRAHRNEIKALVNVDPGEARQAAGLVLNSHMIESNALYRDRAGRISFCFNPADDSVNAFATDQARPIGEGQVVPPPAIFFCAGLARAFQLAATAMALYLNDKNEYALCRTFREIGRAIVDCGGAMTTEAFVKTLEEQLLPAIDEQLHHGDERFISLAQSIRLSMFMEVIAHEIGHIVLCHTLGQAFNYDISRNQEREADSVASSILSTCPWREYHFLGQILGNIIFVWMDERPGVKPEATTHPLSRERFANAFASNSEAAREAERAFGLSRRQLEALLP